MPEIIDVLALLPSDSPYFIVDTGELSVNLRDEENPVDNCMMMSQGRQAIFRRHDNFQVLSMGLILPDSFALSSMKESPYNEDSPSGALFLSIVKEDTVSPQYRIPNFGSYGISLPMENYEMPLGVFVNVVNIPMDDPFYIFGKYYTASGWPQVSMVNVPAAYNGLKLRATLFIKVLHNFPLSLAAAFQEG